MNFKLDNATLFYYVKWIGIVQVIVLLALILLSYALKLYYKYKITSLVKKISNFEKSLEILSLNPIQLSAHDLGFLGNHFQVLIDIIPKMDEKTNLPFWKPLRERIIKEILLPQARKKVFSKYWKARFSALQCFDFRIEPDDINLLPPLIKDEVFIISLNAARIAIEHPTPNLINTIIDTYAQGRKLQQNTFGSIITKFANKEGIIPVIFERLIGEKNVYVKAFCYRLLAQLQQQQELTPTLEEDLISPNRDLVIAVLLYLTHNADTKSIQIIRQHLSNNDWEIRTIAAKCIGILKDKDSIPQLDQLLKDSQWWVRHNAAKALANMGITGIDVLKAQRPDVDRFAYEISQYVLDSKN